MPLLKGLQVNDAPFFAPARRLTLTATDCTPVAELAWLVAEEKTSRHFLWLLTRLEGCAKATEPPWCWTSRHFDGSPIRFRAWLVSPVGYGGDLRGSRYTTFRLHCHLAPDDPGDESPPLFCPTGCTHVAPPFARALQSMPPAVRETLRPARHQQFEEWLIRWFGEKTQPHDMPK